MKKNILIVITMMLLFSLLAAGGAAAFTPTAAVSAEDIPTQTVVARVYFADKADLDSLAVTLDIWEVNQKEGYLVAMLSPERYLALSQAGYKLEIDQAKTDLINQPMIPLPGQGIDTIPNFPCYRTVEETYTDMAALATTNPNLAEWYDIGNSWDKVTAGGPEGYDIFALRLTNENITETKAARFFLMAEIHAREYTTAEMAARYAEHLVANYGIDADITWLLDYFEVYIVPMTNPDGRKFAEDGEIWRKNTDNNDGCITFPYYGTDLNRNNGFKWGGASSNACAETYQGPSADSEPETQIIHTQVINLFPDQRDESSDLNPAPDDATGLLITLHSYSELVLWPWGWTGVDSPNHTQLQTLGRKFAFFNNYTPQQSNELYATTGTTDDWSYGMMGIASYTFEMGNSFFEPCENFDSPIYPDNLDSLLYAFKAARRPYQDPSGPESLNVAAGSGAVTPGELVLLTATANDTRYNNSNGSEPTQNISEARYSLDDPSWAGGTTYPMSATDGSFNSNEEAIQATIDTTGLAAGRHMVYVESKDASDQWGVISAAFLYILDPEVSPLVEGYVKDATTNMPLEATITAGTFQATSDPASGYYSMLVISDTYDISASATGFGTSTASDVVAANYQTVRQDFDLLPVCAIFTDTVEGGNLGWTAQTPWAITTEASQSPTHSWTESPGSDYANNRNTSLRSPAFDFTGSTSIRLSFWHTYETESGYDYGYVEYSTDNTNWNMAASYDDTQAIWTREEIELPDLDGAATAYIRFRFYSDVSAVYDGWHIDDIEIYGSNSACATPLPPTAEFTSNSPVYLGTAVQFTDQTTGTQPLTYSWDFGDSTGSSAETNPSYLYSAPGTYTVTLTVTNNLGTDDVSHPVVVEPVTCSQITSADLSLTGTNPYNPGELIEFSADILPDFATKPYTYTIDFDDGSQVITATSSTDPLTFTHTYEAVGQYVVDFAAWNCDMVTPTIDNQIVVVTTTLVSLSSVDLTLVTSGTIYTGEVVDFSADFLPDWAGKPITYTIDFGDGSAPLTATTFVDPLPLTHTYDITGTYTVTIWAWNEGMTMTEPVSDTVSVTIEEMVVEKLYTYLPILYKIGEESQ